MSTAHHESNLVLPTGRAFQGGSVALEVVGHMLTVKAPEEIAQVLQPWPVNKKVAISSGCTIISNCSPGA